MPVFYFPQYPSKGSRRLGRPWYWTNEWQNYPKLFTRGYKHFERVVKTHNRIRPTEEPWPLIPYLEWKGKAEYFAKNRYRQRRPDRQTQQQRFNQKFFNHMIFEYGAWPSYKNPKYMNLYPIQITPMKAPFITDIRPLKRQYLLDRIGIAAARAWDKTHNKNKRK